MARADGSRNYSHLYSFRGVLAVIIRTSDYTDQRSKVMIPGVPYFWDRDPVCLLM